MYSLARGCTVHVIRRIFDYEFNSKIEINTRQKETDGETLRSFGKIRKVKGWMEKKWQGYLRVQRERERERDLIKGYK